MHKCRKSHDKFRGTAQYEPFSIGYNPYFTKPDNLMFVLFWFVFNISLALVRIAFVASEVAPFERGKVKTLLFVCLSAWISSNAINEDFLEFQDWVDFNVLEYCGTALFRYYNNAVLDF